MRSLFFVPRFLPSTRSPSTPSPTVTHGSKVGSPPFGEGPGKVTEAGPSRVREPPGGGRVLALARWSAGRGIGVVRGENFNGAFLFDPTPCLPLFGLHLVPLLFPLTLLLLLFLLPLFLLPLPLLPAVLYFFLSFLPSFLSSRKRNPRRRRSPNPPSPLNPPPPSLPPPIPL